MVLITIYNPVCGHGTARAFFHDHVLPLLINHSIPIHRTFATEYCGHAGEIVRDLLVDQEEDKLQVILLSGDGTLHEVVNCLSSRSVPHTNRTLSLILVPCGTANALYSSLYPPDSYQPKDGPYELQSLNIYLSSAPHVNPLRIAVNTVFSPSSSPLSEVLSTVVTSTCMHASILHDSEKLRGEYPGPDRYKIAAEKNCDRWYSGHAKLLPLAGSGTVQIFEPSLGRFIDHPDSKEENPIVELQGPFAYFLSTVNVDRLEPTYIIAPLVEPAKMEQEHCTLTIIRPSRSPAFSLDDRGPQVFSAKLWDILNAPYKNGMHIYLRYTDDGRITMEGEGYPVIEYLRCGSWEWHNDASDSYAHLACFDGVINHIPKGGRLSSSVVTERNRVKLEVYA